MLTQQLDSSLLPTDAQHDAHFARQCGKCQRDLTKEDIEIDHGIGDGWCEECRSLEESYEL